MGRKKRRGRSGFHTVKGGGKSKKASTSKNRYAQHLDRDGQKDQLYARMTECAAPGRIARTYTGGRGGTFRLKRCFEVHDPRGRTVMSGSNYKPFLFHGTREWAISQIMLQGFKLPKYGGMFGRAVYLTPDLGKAFGFTDGRNPTIFVCEATLGRVRTFDTGGRGYDLQKALAEGFDTAHGKSGFTSTWGSSKLFWSEYAVYDPNRIRIRYLLEYEPVR